MDQKKIKLTPEQDALYDKCMGNCLTNGMSNIQAENETVKILIDKFPELSVLKNKSVKIAV